MPIAIDVAQILHVLRVVPARNHEQQQAGPARPGLREHCGTVENVVALAIRIQISDALDASEPLIGNRAELAANDGACAAIVDIEPAREGQAAHGGPLVPDHELRLAITIDVVEASHEIPE